MQPQTTQPTNLYQFYDSKGMDLPSLQDRGQLFAKYGGVGEYQGSVPQNNFLLDKLQNDKNFGYVGDTPNLVPAPTVVTSQQANDAISNVQNTVSNYDASILNAPKSDITSNVKEGLDQIDEGMKTEYDTYLDTINRVNRGLLSPEEQESLDAATANFDQNRQLLKEANANYTNAITQIGVRKGLNRYAPELQEGQIKASIDEGVRKMGQLDVQINKSIADMKQAMLDKDFERASKAHDDYLKFIKEKKDNILTIADLANKDRNFLLDQIKAQQTDDIKEYEYAKKQGYTGSFMNFQSAKKAAARAANSPTVVTADDARRYHFPDSLIGLSDAQIIQDLAVSTIPQWFKDFLSETEPNKSFSTEGLQSVWDNYRNSSDLRVFRNLMDINKAYSGNLQQQQEGGGFQLTPEQVSAALNNE